MTEQDSDRSALDEVVDDLLPVELDWRRLVVTYPISSLTVAAVGGFVLGRSHGPELARTLSDFVTHEVSKNVRSVLGDVD
jgi:hypothetical protein